MVIELCKQKTVVELDLVFWFFLFPVLGPHDLFVSILNGVSPDSALKRCSNNLWNQAAEPDFRRECYYSTKPSWILVSLNMILN
jgi:hypothetical protein